MGYKIEELGMSKSQVWKRLYSRKGAKLSDDNVSCTEFVMTMNITRGGGTGGTGTRRTHILHATLLRSLTTRPLNNRAY